LSIFCHGYSQNYKLTPPPSEFASQFPPPLTVRIIMDYGLRPVIDNYIAPRLLISALAGAAAAASSYKMYLYLYLFVIVRTSARLSSRGKASSGWRKRPLLSMYQTN
jgi:hypothetical protein